MDEETIKQLKVTELKAELQKLGLPVSGRKDELQARLLEAINSTSASAHSAAPSATSPQSATNPTSSVPAIVSPKPAQTKSPHHHSSIATGEDNGEEDRLAQRAARFNLPPSEEERRKNRGERFGTDEEMGREDYLAEERLRARQERFGLVSHSRLEQDEFEVQKSKRLQRFGLPSQ